MQDDKIFIKLVEAVEAEGGELVSQTHFPAVHTYVHGDEEVPVEGTGCGQDALLRIGYDDDKGDTVVRRHATFCAVDDMMHLWPRYAPQVFGDA